MKVCKRKLDFQLAKSCKTVADLRENMSSATLAKIRKGNDVLPKTIGLLAKALSCSVEDLLEEV